MKQKQTKKVQTNEQQIDRGKREKRTKTGKNRNNDGDDEKETTSYFYFCALHIAALSLL